MKIVFTDCRTNGFSIDELSKTPQSEENKLRNGDDCSMKVAIIGLGFRLGYLGRVFSEIDPTFEIVGYVDPAPAGLPGLQAAGVSVGVSYETPEQLIAAGGFDLLMIGSPNHLHLDHIRLGLQAGLTVFTEKPIVISIEESL